MFSRTPHSPFTAVALAVGGLLVAAPAMALPLGPDAGLRPDARDIVAVQYGYGHPHHHGWGGRPGFGPGFRHHHGFGPGRGPHFGWRHHGHHHHRGWGHRHGYGGW